MHCAPHYVENISVGHSQLCVSDMCVRVEADVEMHRSTLVISQHDGLIMIDVATSRQAYPMYVEEVLPSPVNTHRAAMMSPNFTSISLLAG